MYKRNKDDDSQFEISFYEAILKDKPDFVEALAALGDLYAKAENYKKSLEVDKKLNEIRPKDPVILYNLACSYSLLNMVDSGLRTLKEAVKCGYADFTFLEKDNDLDNLRKDRRFRAFLAASKLQQEKKAGQKVNE